MVVVVRLLLPSRRGVVIRRQRRRIRGGRGQEQRCQLVDSRAHPSLEGDVPRHPPLQLAPARQEALRRELPLQLLHAVQQHYVLDAGNGLLATMMVVMHRRMNIMVVLMVRYLTAAKGGVRMGSVLELSPKAMYVTYHYQECLRHREQDPIRILQYLITTRTHT